jgi:SAM-dependent methyltransferase
MDISSKEEAGVSFSPSALLPSSPSTSRYNKALSRPDVVKGNKQIDSTLTRTQRYEHENAQRFDCRHTAPSGQLTLDTHTDPTLLHEEHQGCTEQWYQDWFDDHFYMTIYRHRSQEDADRAVALMTRSVELPEQARVLDLCCGAGRHLKALCEAGLQASGIDLSPLLLKSAHQLLHELLLSDKVRLYQGDMRSPYPLHNGLPYHCVTNFFTSFGYFDKHTDNERVLHCVSNALTSRGWFFFDFLNASFVRQTLIPEQSEEIDGLFVVQKRSIQSTTDGSEVVRKDIAITDTNGKCHTFTEQVRLYKQKELAAMFSRAHLKIQQVFGDYDGTSYKPSSPRLILVAQKLVT